MKISLGWVADFVNLDGVTPERIAELLSLHTAEVEGLERIGESIADVVIGEVKECGRHPDADRLSVTKVVYGGAEAVDVVCGAPNVRAGLKIAFAPVGATLPGGLKIQQAKLRGAPSVGMICSERELELSEEHDGILELPDDAPIGERLVDYLGLRDVVLELDNKSLTHRPDLWGHYGFARELAAILRRPLRSLEHEFAWPQAASSWRIELQDADCTQYLGVPIRLPGGPRPSPRAIRARLLAVGARPRNDVVDLSNYVLFETGQPLHAFDASRLRGGVVEVRSARAGESLLTLDDEIRSLDGSELVIADGVSAVALAGVIGGEASAVHDGSEELLLEAASFRAARVRRTAQRFALRTDASSRFEKSLDPVGAEIAARRYCLLLSRIRPDAQFAAAPARAGSVSTPELHIAFDPARCAERLGADPGAEETRGILERLGFGVEPLAESSWRVSVPSWRATKDVSLEVDLVEEVGRLYGYHNIMAAPWSAPVVPPLERPLRRLNRALVTRLIGAHQAYESQAYAFLERLWLQRLRGSESAHLRMVNPVQADADLIRRDPMAALLQQAHDNTRERAQ
ncbi:MAG: phenylalanine--tRNA ligase subunit beta, partial [Planctomycetota bacterium]|nr:phenylalanine--tRNA ligase subunit beta [Planctomycetota bacterium]